MMTLFLIILPGLEDLALRELELKCPTKILAQHKGGIEVEADLDWVVCAHSLLKIPTRILLRLTHFKVRDFPKLHQKFLNLKWLEFLSHPEPVFEVSCSKSRIIHSGRVEETIKEALTKALIRQPLKKDWEKKGYPPQTLLIRIHEDELTLSLDLTGDPLYKRGTQILKGHAPIRESIAAALLFELCEGLQKEVTLIDPMCGSGTFIWEAQNFHVPLHLRSFAFEFSPYFKGKHFRLPSPTKALPINNAYGFDLDEELITKISSDMLKIANSLDQKLTTNEDTIMICNPPYGERLDIKGKRGSFLKEAWTKFLQIDKPLRFGWVLPSDMEDLFKDPVGYDLLTKRRFRNGGMAVTFWVWQKKSPH